MSEQQIALLASSTQTLIGNLADIAVEEENEEKSDEEQEGATDDEDELDLPDGRGRSILCLGGRGILDDAAAAMLSQVLAVQGAEVAQVEHTAIAGRSLNILAVNDVDTVLVTFLNGNSKSHARQVVRRLKRIKPSLRVGVIIPMADGQGSRAIEADEINADFVSPSLTEAVRSALSEAGPVELKQTVRKLARPRLRRIQPAPAA